jgi:hypothetical protein
MIIDTIKNQLSYGEDRFPCGGEEGFSTGKKLSTPGLTDAVTCLSDPHSFF